MSYQFSKQYNDIFGNEIAHPTEAQRKWFEQEFSTRLANVLQQIGCRNRADVIVLIYFHYKQLNLTVNVGKKSIEEAFQWLFKQSEIQMLVEQVTENKS
jgi:hypothetical protein